MAKNTKTVAPVATFAYGEHTVNATDLPESMILALAGLGFSTKLKNVTAGLKPAIIGTSKTSNWSEDDFTAAEKESDLSRGSFETLEGFADAYAAWVVAEEFAAILDGTASFGSARGPRLKGIDWYINEIAKGLWPKFKAKVPGYEKERDGEFFTAWRDKNADTFRPAAQKRMDEDKALEALEEIQI